MPKNLVRRAEPQLLEAYLRQLIERKRDLDFPWFPARVVCHDILGQTALVDLAGLRDAIAEQGGDPAQVNPVVPVQLIVDHSLAVEYAGFDKQAFAKNRSVEDRRNADRFHFIEWTKRAFENMEVIPPGNGIMHQINLEKMSPVIYTLDGVAFPDTCVGTDSHTPHVDALGVIAVGVGGLEAENVMLGRASWMRLPDIIGVELTGRPAPGITATDIVLALTEFLRAQRVVGAYLEFYGDGARALTIGDRATISNMTPEFGATAAMFYIDQQTIDYLRLTGREDAQVALVETYARHTGLWADDMATAHYERVLQFDLASVVRNMAGPSNPHKRVATTELAQRGIAGTWEAVPGQMPDGAVIIAAITSCTNTSNPRNVIAAGLLARNANARGLTRKPWVKSSLAPGSKAVQLYLEEAGLLSELEQLGFGIVAFACTTCNGMSGALDPVIQQQIIDRDLYATAVLSGNRNFDGRIHPYAKQAFLASPPLVIAYAIAGTVRFDIEKGCAGHRCRGRAGHVEGSMAERCRDRCGGGAQRQAGTLPQRVRPDVQAQRGTGDQREPLCTTGARPARIFGARRIGKARWRGRARCAACARWPCWATTSPPTMCRRRTRSWPAVRPANIWRTWACRKKTSILTPPTAATTSPRSVRRLPTPR